MRAGKYSWWDIEGSMKQHSVVNVQYKAKTKNQSTQKNNAAHVDLPEKLPRALMDLSDGVETICWIPAFRGPPAPPAGESDKAIMKPVIVSPFPVAFE